MERVETLIIGGGIAGLATAWHLGQRGARDVLLLERESELGTHSSTRNAAILRTGGTDPLLAEMGRSGAAFLREPPADFAPVPLVDTCGLVLVGRPATLARLRAAAAPGSFEELSAERLRELAPGLDSGAAEALLFPAEGRIDIHALLQGFARGAERAGVGIRRTAGVRQLLRTGQRVCGARLADGSLIHATTIVLAAGGWAARLGAHAGSRVELSPTRRHLLATAPLPHVDPRSPVVWELDEAFYYRPERGGLLLCACDQEPTDPDRDEPDPELERTIRARAARTLPGLEGLSAARTARFWSGIRTLTADGRFAVGADPDVDGLFWVAGLGGSGMVCGPEVGRIAAALLDATSIEPLDPQLVAGLDPARLSGSPERSAAR